MTAEFFSDNPDVKTFLFNLLINYKEVGRKKADKKLVTISNLQKTY